MFQHYNYFGNQQARDTRFYLASQGLSKGNMSVDLYDNFSNYVPRELPYTKDNELKSYNFAIIDIGLYLDTHPDDMNTKVLYDQYVAKYNELLKTLEQQNGMYYLTSPNNNKMWQWNKSFPWEVGK